ncbi:hypothetical protein pb186bvf_019049 [Paramecium bursaria]
MQTLSKQQQKFQYIQRFGQIINLHSQCLDRIEIIATLIYIQDIIIQYFFFPFYIINLLKIQYYYTTL